MSVRRTVLCAGALTLVLAGFSSAAQALKEKDFIKPVLEKPAKGTEAHFDAAKVTYDPRTRIATASGAVRITYGPYVLFATHVTYNQETNQFDANGSVEIQEPNGNVMQAQSLIIKDKFKQAFAKHLRALLTNDVTITALYARRDDNGITVFENATYTACKTCETRSGNPLWELQSDETVHDKNEKMLYHTNPRLKIAGHTVFGLPYYEHPDPTVKRKTGFLRPEFKRSREMGIGFVLPYFYAPAPDWDLTFRPMITTHQGPVADVELRKAFSNGKFTLRGMGIYELSPDRTIPGERWRGAVETTGDFKLNEDWSWGWDGKIATDRHFYDDYEFEADEITASKVHVTGLWDRNYVSAQAIHFHTMSGDIVQDHLPTALPFVSGEHYFSQDVMGGDLSLNWSAYSIFRERENTPYTDVHHAEKQTRAMAELRWKSQFISDGGVVVTPFARARSDLYLNVDLPDPTVPGGIRENETLTRFLPAGGVDMRWPLISDTRYGQSIFSPVAQLIAATNEKDVEKIGNEDAITLNFDHTSLFLEDRFTGYDRFEGGLRANLGFTWSILGANGGFLRASAGESFHLLGENSFATGSGLEGSKSDLVAAITVQPFDFITASYQIRAEEDLSGINRQEALASLTFDRFSGNIGYLSIAAEPAYGRNRREEWFEADARIGLTESWYLFGGFRYDIENTNLERHSLGLEFDCDCMNFKLAYSGSSPADSSDTDHRVMISIDFATLGGAKASAGF